MNGLRISEWVSQNRSNLNWKHLVVFALLITAIGIQEVKAQFAGGSGTLEDPYQVETFAQLNSMRNHLNSNFILSNDVIMMGLWSPVGTYEIDFFGQQIGEPFTGSFNGNGYTLKGFLINESESDNVGLFGSTNSASITNLTIELSGVQAGTSDNVGVIVGRGENTSISSSKIISSPGFSALIEGNKNVGGVAGYIDNGSTITNSSAEGITISASIDAGGLIGRIISSSVTQAFADANVSAAGSSGGLIGNAESSTIDNSYAVGFVRGNSSVGGFIGAWTGTNEKSITNDDPPGISNSYAASRIEADRNAVAGVFIGFIIGDIQLFQNSYSAVQGIPAIGDDGTGGSTNIFTYSKANQGLTGFTQNEMQQQASFEGIGFDFETVWQINEGSSFPFLQENPQDPPPFVEIIPEFAGGDGSSGDPYQIEFPLQLDNIRDYPNASFVLIADINLDIFPYNLDEGWDPIGIGTGFPTIPFTGTIDGGGHTISNLYVNTTSNSASLLGFAENCAVNDLNFEYATVMGGQRTGILASQSTGCTFENIEVRDESFTSLPKTAVPVGNTFSASEIDSLSNVVSGTFYVGGLVGYVISSTFDSVFVEASVSNSGSGTGGIAGILLTSSSITNSASAGKVYSEGNNTGGIAGENLTSSLIRQSYSTSLVEGGNLYSGGLVGNNSNSARIANSYALGSVNGTRDVGGLVGRNAAVIDSSYSAGEVSGDTNTGGLVGSNSSQVNNSFWNIETSGFGISAGGIPFSDGAIKTQDSLSTLIDFTSIWSINEGSSFPYLQSNTPLTPPALDIPQIFAGGSGTVLDPYQISTVFHLNNVKNFPNSNFSLQNDLSLTPSDYSDEEEGWVPIGSESFPFTKTFAGNDFTISNLFINRGLSDNIGFFGYVENGTVSNLNLTNVNITGNNKVGGLVGYQKDAGVEHSTVTGSVTSINDRVGGLVGNQEGATVEHSMFSGSVTGDFWVGGLIGFQGESSSTTNSSSDALINGTGIIGGLIGNSVSSGIEQSFSTSEVHASGDHAGGLVGINSASTITESYYAGEGVFGDINVGGLVGENESSSAISNSYSVGGVEGTSHVGGFVGLNSSSNLIDNYSAGMVTGVQSTGGFLGEIAGIASESVFWNTQTSGQGASPGTASVGLTDTQAKQQASYTGFEFGTIWGINEGSSYPFLLNAVQSPGPVLDIPEFFAGGSGTQLDPYLVSTPDHLNNVKRYLDRSYRQVSDIDMNVQPYNINEGWYPIGSGEFFGDSWLRFEGEFDGDGHAIKYLFINRPTVDNTGLFGWTEGATITNVHLEEVNISGKVYTGALAGRFSNSTIDSSSSSGKVAGTVRVGGLIGSNETSDISGSSSKADITASGSYAGGLVGRHDDGNISESYSTGEVNGNDWLGGLIGFMSDGSVSDSYSTSQVTGDGVVGGLVGNNSTNGLIENVYSSGLVTGNSSVGGLTGLDTGSMTGGWWNTESSGQASSASGTGLTDPMMRMETSFTGFDFAATWSITETETFPFLQQNIQSPGPGIPVVLPGAVVLSSPSNDSLNVSTSITLQWGIATDAISYHVQVSANEEFTSVVAQNEEVAELAFALNNLDNLTTYYWRVRGENEFGFGEWSDTWEFTTTGVPPGKVVLISPADAFEGATTEPILEWNSAATAESYSLQLSVSEEFTTLITNEENLMDTSFNISSLEGLTTYYWRIRAVNEFGDGEWSDTWEFTTTGVPPGKVVLISPADAVEDVAIEPTFEWKSMETATSYSLQLSASDAFTNLIVNEDNLADTSFQVSNPVNDEKAVAKSTQSLILEGLTTYFWRVRAVNEFGNGDWSDTWKFTTTVLVSNEDEPGIPIEFVLSQNYPNPFNPSSTIRFGLPQSEEVTLQVFNTLGQQVATLVSNEKKEAGWHSVQFNAGSLASGMYIYRIKAGSFVQTKKMMLIK